MKEQITQFQSLAFKAVVIKPAQFVHLRDIFVAGRY